jgi:hypothetical protein
MIRVRIARWSKWMLYMREFDSGWKTYLLRLLHIELLESPIASDKWVRSK